IRNRRPGTIRGTVQDARRLPHSDAPRARTESPRRHAEPSLDTEEARRGAGLRPKRRLLPQNPKKTKRKLPLFFLALTRSSEHRRSRHDSSRAPKTKTSRRHTGPLPVRLRPCDLPFRLLAADDTHATARRRPSENDRSQWAVVAVVKALCCGRLAGRIPWSSNKEAPLSRLRRSSANDDVGDERPPPLY
ncbi:unnamed protein product, partial [Ixodes hexagonus]